MKYSSKWQNEWQIMLKFFLYFFLAIILPNGSLKTNSGGLLNPGPLKLELYYHPQDKFVVKRVP